MAELIPLEYRLHMARQRLVSRWGVIVVLTLCVAGVGLACVYHWQQKQARVFAQRSKEFQDKSVLIRQAKDLQAKRVELAARMQKMQELRDDQLLLSLLKSVSDGFTPADCLKYIRIEAHPDRTAQSKDSERYTMRIEGITVNDASHSRLLERLTDIGKKSVAPFSVPLGEKRIETVLDSEATFFDITCNQAIAKGG